MIFEVPSSTVDQLRFGALEIRNWRRLPEVRNDVMWWWGSSSSALFLSTYMSLLMSLFNVRWQHECLQGHAFDLYYVMPTPLIYPWRGLLTCAFQPTRLKSNCAANSAEQPLPTSTTQHLLLSNSTPMFYHVCIMYVGTQKISRV